MPVIPGSQESQVLVPGSPVPIAGSGDARAPGEAMAGFGSAVFALGQAAKDIKERRDSITIQLASTEYQRRAMIAQATREGAAPLPGDYTGVQQANGFAEDMQPHAQDIASQIDDPETRRAFLAQAGEIQNSLTREVIAKEVKKQADYNDFLVQRGVSAESALLNSAAHNYSGAPENILNSQGGIPLDEGLSKAEALVRTSGIAPARMDQEIRAAKQRVVSDAINGAVDGGNYDAAKFIARTSSLYFDETEREKLLSHISDVQYKENQRIYSDLSKQDKEAELDAKKNFLGVFNKIAVLKQQAGNNQTKLDALEPMILAAKAKYGMLIPGADNQLDALQRSTAYSAPKDRQYEISLYQQIASGKLNYSAAIDKVQADTFRGDGQGVSIDGGSRIIERLRATSDRIKNDPNYQKQITFANQLIDNQALPDLAGGVYSFDRKTLKDKADEAKIEFMKELGADGKSDPGSLANEIIERYFGKKPGTFRGSFNTLEDHSAEAIKKRQMDMANQYTQDKLAGKLSKQKEADYQHNLGVLEQMRQDALVTERSRKERTSPNGVTAPAGGK